MTTPTATTPPSGYEPSLLARVIAAFSGSTGRITKFVLLALDVGKDSVTALPERAVHFEIGLLREVPDSGTLCACYRS